MELRWFEEVICEINECVGLPLCCHPGPKPSSLFDGVPLMQRLTSAAPHVLHLVARVRNRFCCYLADLSRVRETRKSQMKRSLRLGALPL